MNNLQLTKNRKIYTGTGGKVLKLMQGGATQAQAAYHLGIDPSVVSKYASEEDFKAQLQEALVKGFEEAQKVDEDYNEIEKLAVKKLRDLMTYVQTPNELIKMAKFANEAKRKLPPVTETNDEKANNAPVRLIVASVIKQTFIMSPNSEVVAIEGRALETLNSSSIDSLLQQKRDPVTIEQQVENQPKFIEKASINGRAKQSEDKWSGL